MGNREFDTFYDLLKERVGKYDKDASERMREAQIKPLFYKLHGYTRTNEEIECIIESFAYGFSTGAIETMRQVVGPSSRGLEREIGE